MGVNYHPYIEAAIARKLAFERRALDHLTDDPTVPRKMLRSIDRARAQSFGLLGRLRDQSLVTRGEVERTLADLNASYEMRKGRHDTADPDGFGTGVYVDAMQVLREALEAGDAAEG